MYCVRDDQDISHIVFQANRGGVITGQIKDEDSEPVSNALVTIFQLAIVGGERKILPRGQARADAAGNFRVPGLLRGNYYVCAMGRPWFADSLLQFEQIQETANRQRQGISTRVTTGPPQPDDDPSPEPSLDRHLIPRIRISEARLS